MTEPTAKVAALAASIEARLPGLLQRAPSLPDELCYEVQPDNLKQVCLALRDSPELKFEILIDLAGEAPPPGGWYIYGSHHFTREASDRVGARIAEVIAGLLEGDGAPGRDLRRRARERGLTPARRDDVRWPSG